MNAIKADKFFYSLPIKAGPDGLIVNPYISGADKFSPEYFSDKFFINVTPESERLLIDLNEFFKAPTLDTESKDKPEETQEEKDARETKKAQEAEDKRKAEEAAETEARKLAERDRVDNPISSFIADSKITIQMADGTSNVVSPFEDLYDFFSHIQDVNGLKLPGILIGTDEMIDIIKKIQDSPYYADNKNSLELINMLFGIDGLAIPKSNGVIKPMDFVKKIIDPSADKKLKQTVIEYCKNILDKISKCK